MNNTENRASRNGRRFCRATFAWILPLFLFACTTGPDYARPELKVPTRYKTPEYATAGSLPPGRDWWKLFNDEQLNTLIEEALAANEDLKAAMARVEQSRASTAAVKSAFYPAINMQASATRSGTDSGDSGSGDSGLSQTATTLNQLSSVLSQIEALREGNTATTGTAQQSSSSTTGMAVETTSNRFQVPFDLSYEIDLWGKLRRSHESARAQSAGTVAALELVRQTIAADLARNYFDLRALDAETDILARNLGLYEEQYSLTRQKMTVGLSTETDALQAEVQLESTHAQAADTSRQRADIEHAIAILLGRAPADFALAPQPLTASLPTVPGGLPSELLRRRPDVAEAEQNLIAANAEIGAAQAELYPSIKLTGSAGFESGEISQLLDWQSRFWSFGPSISLPIFNGGQLRANVNKAKARYDELAANYRYAVLAAFRDVEDSLNDLQGRGVQAEAQAKARAAAAEYLRLTQIEYDTGSVDYLQVINAEQTVLGNELTEVGILKERMVSTVLLIKALGGGWDAAALSPGLEHASPAQS